MKKALLAAALFWFSYCAVALDPEKIRQVLAEDQLSGELKVLKDTDGGVYALLVFLQNNSARDIVIRLREQPFGPILIQIHDQHGKRLSKPLGPYDTSQRTSYVLKGIPKSGSHQWFIPIAEELQDKKPLEAQFTGRISAGIIFHYTVPEKAEDLSAFKLGVISLHDTEVLFTADALKGDARKKYEELERKTKGTVRPD